MVAVETIVGMILGVIGFVITLFGLVPPITDTSIAVIVAGVFLIIVGESAHQSAT